VVFLAFQNESIRAVEPLLFYPFALMAMVGALWVVFSQQIVRMAVALLITLAGVAALYFLLEAEFIAAIQLVVYVGGTLILIIFGVMLTTKGPGISFPLPIGQRVMGWFIGFVAMLIMGYMAVFGIIAEANLVAAEAGQATFILGPTEAHGHLATLQLLGELLISSYVIPLEIAAVLLLIVMIGAAYLAKGRQRRGETNNRDAMIHSAEGAIR